MMTKQQNIKKIMDEIDDYEFSLTDESAKQQNQENEDKLHELLLDLIIDKNLIYEGAKLWVLTDTYLGSGSDFNWGKIKIAVVHRVIPHRTHRSIISIEILPLSEEVEFTTLLVDYGLCLLMRYHYLLRYDKI